MLRKKRTTSAMALMIAIGLVLSGCNGKEALFKGSSPKKAEKVKVVFWDDNTGPQRTPIWEELITRFEKENPTIDVEYVGLP